ncbi:flagellar basal body-associated FliL family protein [Alkalimarinus sediminis]|uniref:Flagellar protein FliL n=1 Tax=Alkalimarinus sediminis TaxID=1632866 RepID=A0A9E8HQ99_9ALTE|nr:flagellar basal body-associated FliL family protein [Alkalimarinus sediminis]UZW76743.1 flagellar basal body-associated FliL family protein [Alkalimarinus sediminis]
MAADDNNSENQEEQGGKSKKKLIIIVAIVVILAIGLSVGATLFFLKGDDSGSSEDEAVPAEEVKMPAVYLDIKPPFVVTYDVSGRQRYMQVFVSAQSRSQESLDEMELHMPLIRNKLIMLFSSQDFEALQTPEGKAALRTESLTLINEILEKEASGSSIEQVLFTNFVMQ